MGRSGTVEKILKAYGQKSRFDLTVAVIKIIENVKLTIDS